VIDFRYHVVSIVAVLLALAVGLLIGSTTLRPAVAHDLKSRTDSLAARNGDLKTANQGLSQEVASGNDFDSALIPYILNGRLSGQSVVLVSSPDADSATHDQLVEALTTAGATVSGDVQLRDPLLDPDQDAFLATLTNRLGVHSGLPAAATGAERALAVLARSLVVRPDRTAPSQTDASQVVSAFTAGKLVSVSGDVHPADLAILLTGAPPTATPSPTPTPTVAPTLLTEFATDLVRFGRAVVVAGPSAAASSGGVVSAVRADKLDSGKLSTVDGTDRPSGVIATVLALAAEINGSPGDYGSSAGADAPIPTLTPTP
jgi:hypothetical protein